MTTPLLIIGMPLKNNQDTVGQAIQSFLRQEAIQYESLLIIANDGSTDRSLEIVRSFLPNKKLLLVHTQQGSAYGVRNFLLDYVRNHYPNCYLIGRLDADDQLASPTILSRIERLYEQSPFDVLLMGNQQIRQGRIQPWINRPSETLLDNEVLGQYLQRLAEGDPKAELPSCNTFIRPTLPIYYPPIVSAEDHWFNVFLLLQSHRLSIRIQPSWIYAIYSLDGLLTQDNHTNNKHKASRQALYAYFKAVESLSLRQRKVFDLLQSFQLQAYHLLGEGASSVVFHNNKQVYKFILWENMGPYSYKRECLQGLVHKIDRFKDSPFFYPIQQLGQFEEGILLSYPFEPSTPCITLHRQEAIEFLTTCWQRRLVFPDIKPSNFIRIEGQLKWIDYEPDRFTDNLFLNMATRAFIYCQNPKASPVFIEKLRRSAINQFDLPELKGLQEFLNHLYSHIIFSESYSHFPKDRIEEVASITSITASGTYLIPYREWTDEDSLFFALLKKGLYLDSIRPTSLSLENNGYFSPRYIALEIHKLKAPVHPVSLIIKACSQDSEVIFELVKHIRKQLASPNIFLEVILALDTRTDSFLRQYTQQGSWEQLLTESHRLYQAGIIDTIIFPSKDDIQRTNKVWFGLETDKSHTVKGVPVASQLYAFDQAQSPYILQMDCDVMIGRTDLFHSFLTDMLTELDKNPDVLSVGFNICKNPHEGYTPYFGFEKGGFVPEVRFCLLHRDRIKGILPLPNRILSDGLELSWYRSLEKRQKLRAKCSIRGGDSRSFYIHPPNFKKVSKDTWLTILDCVEREDIPPIQYNEFDLVGSYYDWTANRRNESMVVITRFRDVSLPRFLRFWYSLISQSFTDWGLILIDDASETRQTQIIRSLIKEGHQDKVTFIQNRHRIHHMANFYKAIHYFMGNQESIVLVLDGDDGLLGRNALQNVYEKYTNEGADVVIGKMYRADKLSAHYKYTPDFLYPRRKGGNVWQHLRSFKKYLFDSLSIYDLKVQVSTHTTDALLSRKLSHQFVFPEYCGDFAYMVPIVEMSKKPLFINHFNYYHERTTPSTPEIKNAKEKIIAALLNKPKKSPADVFKGRKTFLPNLSKVEIDLTYHCNLKCVNCNRSSTQAPTNKGMELSQLQNFVRESIEVRKKWELINLLGGEPTLHPQFLEIIALLLYEYIDKFSPKTILQVTSNGYGKTVQDRLAALPKHPQLIIDYASFKDSRKVPYFSPFNDAPIDKVTPHTQEYHKGCWVTSYCGIGLNALGYYPCGVAGGIDRVFGFHKGIQHLKDVDASIKSLLTHFCQFCGNFTDYAANRGDFIPRHEKALLTKPVISATWRKQYKKYNQKSTHQNSNSSSHL